MAGGAASEEKHSPRAMLAPNFPRAHKPVVKTTSLTLAGSTTTMQVGSEAVHSVVGKSASLGLPNMATPATDSNPQCSDKKVPPPRPPPPNITHKNSSENAPDPLNPFDEDYFKAEQAPEKREDPVAPPRKQKQKHGKPLVHQPALDVPLSPCTDSVKSTHCSIINPVSSAGVTALAPVISFPRSVSEVTEISKAGTTTSQPTCENPDLLSPATNLKPKSSSTASLPAQRRHSGAAAVEPSDMSRLKELASKTMSDPKQHLRDGDKGDLRKSSSDSNIPTGTSPVADFIDQSSNEPWFKKKIQKKAKKKLKHDHEEGSEDSSSVRSLVRNDSDGTEKRSRGNSECGVIDREDNERKQSDSNDLEEMLDNFDPRESPREVALKTPSSNKNFFSRVSLKIKALGGRKSSNEDDDSGPLSGHWSSQRSQERHSKIKIEVMDLSDDAARKHTMQKVYLSDVLQSRKTVGRLQSKQFCSLPFSTPPPQLHWLLTACFIILL